MKIFGSTLLQPARSVCVSLSAFSVNVELSDQQVSASLTTLVVASYT